MTTVSQGSTAEITLTEGQELYIKTAGTAVIKYGRGQDVVNRPSVVHITSTDSEKRYGPYPVEMNFTVEAVSGAANYSNSATVIKGIPADGSDLAASINSMANALGAQTNGMTPEEIAFALANAVTSEDVNDIVVLTQAEYDAITPTTGTLYIIEG